jgi:hypothetical protein
MNKLELRGSEVCKPIRKILKDLFPDTKFSVRYKSYAGGNSVNVEYEFGPPESQVTELLKPFEQGSFCGMEDIYNFHSDDRKVIIGGEEFILDGGTKYLFVNKNWPSESVGIGAYAKTIEWGFDQMETVTKIRRSYLNHDFKTSAINIETFSVYKKPIVNGVMDEFPIGFNYKVVEKPMQEPSKLEMLHYSEFSVAVFGTDFSYAKDLKNAGGRYNKFLTHPSTNQKTPGWIFPASKKESVRNLLKIA